MLPSLWGWDFQPHATQPRLVGIPSAVGSPTSPASIPLGLAFPNLILLGCSAPWGAPHLTVPSHWGWHSRCCGGAPHNAIPPPWVGIPTGSTSALCSLPGAPPASRKHATSTPERPTCSKWPKIGVVRSRSSTERSSTSVLGGGGGTHGVGMGWGVLGWRGGTLRWGGVVLGWGGGDALSWVGLGSC